MLMHIRRHAITLRRRGCACRDMLRYAAMLDVAAACLRRRHATYADAAVTADYVISLRAACRCHADADFRCFF